MTNKERNSKKLKMVYYIDDDNCKWNEKYRIYEIVG